MHRFLYLVTTLAFTTLAARQRCPTDHPFAFNHGKSCCATNIENGKRGNLDRRCDGSVIDIKSTCCSDDDYVECPTVPCENHHGKCSSQACMEFSESLSKNMDPEEDPCEDFEKYACGKYIKEHVINESLHSSFLAKTVRIEIAFEKGKALLEEEPSQESEFKTDELLRIYYKSCMNLDRIERESRPKVKEIFKNVGGFPVIEGDNWNGDGFNLWDVISKLQKYGFKTDIILKFYVGIDIKNTKSMALHFDQPSLGLSRVYLIEGFHHRVVQYYYEYMVEVAKNLGADNATAHEDMEKALKFEIGLAKISASYFERLDDTKLYNNTKTIGDLEGQPGYPPLLKGFINKIFDSAGVSGMNFGNDDVVYLKNLEYAGKLSELLDRTSPRAIANYICWRLYKSLDRLLDKSSRGIREVFMRKAWNIPQDPLWWVRCGHEVGIFRGDEHLNIALGSRYVRKYFRKDIKEKVDMMVKQEREVLKSLLEDNKWMSGKTKKHALDKLEAMGQHIGYLESILNPEMLNNLFKDLKLTDSNTLLENTLEIQRFWRQYFLKIFKLPVDIHDAVWNQAILYIDVLYYNFPNWLEFPAAGLGEPESGFNPDYPMYFNYGALGRQTAAAMMGGFYEEGRYYDKDANLNYWWDEDTLAKYNQKSKCVVDQYNSYRSEQVGMNLVANESVTNIKEIAGIKVAYAAYELYEKCNGPEEPVDGHNFTPDQLFFLSFAQSVCGKYRDQELRDLIQYGGTPSKFRIMGPLSNNPNFAKAFNCPLGSKMNPSEKCNVW